MLNEILILQFITLLVIFFLFWSNEIFTSLLLSVLYLSVISLFAFAQGTDIITSFLIIIDLGVFLILFSFLLHTTKFLQTKNIFSISYLNFNKFFIILSSLILCFYFYFFESTYISSKIIEKSWTFFISYYDYYNIYYLQFNNDLQLLKEIYFHISNYEFFLISFAIYVGLISAYTIFKLSNKWLLNLNSELIENLSKFNVSNSSYFFKYQNIINQSKTKANSKIWYKKKKWF